MAGEYASCASCPIAQCSRSSNRQRVGNSLLFFFFFLLSFLKWHHHMSAWLEYLGTVAPLNGAVYHRTLLEAAGALLLNHSLHIYFARSGNEECILFCNIFLKEKKSFSCVYTLPWCFVLPRNTDRHLYLVFNRLVQAGRSKWTWSRSVLMVLQSYSITRGLIDSVKIIAPGILIACASSSRNQHWSLPWHFDLGAVSSFSFGSTSV